MKSILILRTFKARIYLVLISTFSFLVLFLPGTGFARIFIDINDPAIPKLKIAIPNFINWSAQNSNPELEEDLTRVVTRDLDFSGYFLPMEKESFIEEQGRTITSNNIVFRNWSVIGADLLLKGGYTCIGRSIEIEARLYDVVTGRQILGKRLLGKAASYRELMHRLGNEIIKTLTGQEGMFLSKLAFVGKKNGQKEIFLSDYDGFGYKPITSDQSLALSPCWSPQGDKIVYTSYREGSPMMYLRDMKSGKDQRISSRKGLNIGAAWSPDGQRLAVTLSYKDNPDIYLVDLKGKIIKQLTNHWGIDVSPSFSPDGNKIAYVSNRSGNPQIYIKDLQNGRGERVTYEGKYNTSPDWSSRNRIVFAGMHDGLCDIFSMEADGRDLRQLTEESGFNEDPCWSPDGRYIVFSSNRDGGYHLYLMNANGQNQRRITFIKGVEETSPSWSVFDFLRFF